VQSLVAGWLGGQLLASIQLSFPNHVTHPVADQEKQLHDIIGEGKSVKGQGADFRNMGAEWAVNAATFDAQDDAEINGYPFNFRIGATICAPGIALVNISDLFEQFWGVFLIAVAIGSDVWWPSANCDPPVDAVAIVPDRASMWSGMGWALAGESRTHVTTRRIIPQTLRCCLGASPLDCALQCVIDGGNPIAHIFFRGGLVNPFEMGSYDFKAEPTVSITRCPDRSHAKIDWFHVQVKLLLPITVLWKLALVENNPKSVPN
jgi:hypothetical protein